MVDDDHVRRRGALACGSRNTRRSAGSHCPGESRRWPRSRSRTAGPRRSSARGRPSRCADHFTIGRKLGQKQLPVERQLPAISSSRCRQTVRPLTGGGERIERLAHAGMSLKQICPGGSWCGEMSTRSPLRIVERGRRASCRCRPGLGIRRPTGTRRRSPGHFDCPRAARVATARASGHRARTPGDPFGKLGQARSGYARAKTGTLLFHSGNFRHSTPTRRGSWPGRSSSGVAARPMSPDRPISGSRMPRVVTDGVPTDAARDHRRILIERIAFLFTVMPALPSALRPACR